MTNVAHFEDTSVPHYRSRPTAPQKLERHQADQCLAQSIVRRLFATGYGPLFRVSVETSGGRVTLLGAVPTYYMKQVAQTAALSVPGVEALENAISVRSHAPECEHR